jgi:hypothetical protein
MGRTDRLAVIGDLSDTTLSQAAGNGDRANLLSPQEGVVHPFGVIVFLELLGFLVEVKPEGIAGASLALGPGLERFGALGDHAALHGIAASLAVAAFFVFAARSL